MVSLMSYAVVLLLIALVIALLVNKPFFKQLAIKFRGRTDEIMRQDASTPKGAKDYFNEAIEGKRKAYQNADRLFIETSGKLEESEKELYNLKKDLMKIDQQINTCFDSNNDADARQYAMRKITIQKKIEVLKECIEEQKKAKEQNQIVRDNAKRNLDELEEEKERTIYQLEADQQIIALHESMNAATSLNENDKMLERVREGARKTRERAAGAQIAYDSSSEAMDRRMEQQERNREADELLNEMRRRRGAN